MRSRLSVASLLAIPLCLLALPAFGQQAPAKPKPRPANSPELKRLDAKVEEVRESFLRDTTKLILSFEDVGQYERAKMLLESLQKLDPKNQVVNSKIAELNRQILDASEFEIDIDPGESWQPVGLVAKGRPLRILVTGDYKLLTSITATADGAPSDNPAEDMIPHVPFGAVMALAAFSTAIRWPPTRTKPVSSSARIAAPSVLRSPSPSMRLAKASPSSSVVSPLPWHRPSRRCPVR